MVKRGGTKRKAEIKKITDKNSKATTFTKRRDGLFSKAAQLCLLGDAQIAVLATPSSSNSNVSFFSFGHSSVDSVVSAYLSGQRPVPVPVQEESKETKEDIGICMARKDLGLGYWWDDEKLERSKDPQEIMQAIESMKILQRDAERLLEDEAIDFDQREGSLVVTDEKNEKILQKDAERLLEDEAIDFDHEKKSKSEVDQTLIVEDDQIMFVCDSFCNNDKNSALSTHDEENFEEWSEMDIEKFISGFDFENKSVEEEEEDHQFMESSENLKEWSDMDLQQLLTDVEKTEEDNHQTVEVSGNSCCNNNNNNNALLLPDAAAAGELNDLIDYDIADLDLDSMFEGLNSDEFAASFLNVI